MAEPRSAADPAALSTFGDVLRFMRRRARLTQRELALAVGYSPEHVCRMEQNQRAPNRAALQALFVPALGLEHEPELAAQLMYAATSHDAPSSPPQPFAHLPMPLTPLVGRTRELAHIAQLLEDPACRVVTLVGLGGSGKTRLAIAAGQEQHARFADGVVWVPLAPLHAPELVVVGLMNALQIQRTPHTSPMAQLQAHMRAKHVLLILDNAEHLLPGMPVLFDLLHHAPGVKLLITSRERLHMQGEWIVEIGGLAVPTAATGDMAVDEGAVQLFEHCARRLHAGFTLASNITAVVRICQTVAGLPLGVELAAQWLRVLTCAEIADELCRDMDLLVSHGQDVLPRHRSLRAVFDHSWNLLQPAEQRALRRLSVFHGGFSRDAAAQVAGAQLPLLRALIDKALLVCMARDRYDLHPLVRQYAHDQLVRAGEDAATYARHADWYAALAQHAAPQLVTGDQRTWLHRLEAEHDNLRAAMRWLLAAPKNDAMSTMVVALVDFWRVHGYFNEGRHWLEAVLAQDNAFSPAVRATVLGGLGELVWAQGEYPYAQQVLEESLALHQVHTTPAQVAAVLHRLGAIAGYQGNYDRATALYNQSLALRRDLDDERGIAATLNNLGITAQEQGDEQRAADLFAESLELFRAHAHQHGTAIVLNNLGDLAQRQGDLARAAALLQESMVLRHQLGDHHGIAIGLRGLADVAAAEGRAELAARLWGASEALCDAHGVGVPPSDRERYDHAIAAARALVDDATFHAAWHAGRALSLEQALATAQTVGSHVSHADLVSSVV